MVKNTSLGIDKTMPNGILFNCVEAQQEAKTKTVKKWRRLSKSRVFTGCIGFHSFNKKDNNPLEMLCFRTRRTG